MCSGNGTGVWFWGGCFWRDCREDEGWWLRIRGGRWREDEDGEVRDEDRWGRVDEGSFVVS